MCFGTVVDHLQLMTPSNSPTLYFVSVCSFKFGEYVVVVWWRVAICMVAWQRVWLVVAPQYLMLLTTCVPAVRPSGSSRQAPQHCWSFLSFPAHIIRKFSPSIELCLLTTAGLTLFRLWHHLTYCEARWSFRMNATYMTCVRVCMYVCMYDRQVNTTFWRVVTGWGLH